MDNMEHNKVIFRQSVSVSYVMEKKITLKCGNILRDEHKSDLLIASAFCGSYRADEGTMMGALRKEGINVSELADKADQRFNVYDEDGIRRCWVSEEISHSQFQRIACIELKTPFLKKENKTMNKQKTEIDLLKNVFPMFRQMLEKVAAEKVLLRRIIMTIPGIGNQKMEIGYVAPVLLAQCNILLRNIRELEEIVIYEKDEKKLEEIQNILGAVQSNMKKQVFISYSSKDNIWADRIFDNLKNSGILCWKAPEDIPAGSNYQTEIPKGLQETYILLVILSENSERSRWCYKEIGSAIGSGHIVIPVKVEDYESSDQFKFLMDGEQIFPAYDYLDKGSVREMLEKLTKIVLRFVQNHEIYFGKL